MQIAYTDQSLTKGIEPFERDSALGHYSAKVQARAPLRPLEGDGGTQPAGLGGWSGRRRAPARRPLPVISPPLSERRGFPRRNRNPTCSCP